MHSRAIAILATLAFCGSCAVTGQEAEQSAAREPQTEKMSLDEALDDHRSVTLLDDETGEKKLICKRVVVTGDRFVRKTCATPEEWAQKKRDSQDELDGLQRRMDAKCPTGAC